MFMCWFDQSKRHYRGEERKLDDLDVDLIVGALSNEFILAMCCYLINCVKSSSDPDL